MTGPLGRVASLKVKLGLLVVASVVVTAVVASLGRATGVPAWLSIPVTVGLALGVTQLLAAGMIAPLRRMTAASRRMAAGEVGVRVEATSADEVGELARAFDSMARDLEEVDRRRRDLVANVSHELRTPLAGLRAVLENHVDGVGVGVGPGTPGEALRPALAQAERLSALVEDLLDLARVDAGRAPLAAAPVTVAKLLADVAAEPRARPVAVVADTDPPDLVVHADARRLHQLVANLVDNAVRHSPSDGAVHLRASRAPDPADGWRLEVQDDGPGVAPDDRERVFERFGTLDGPAGGGGTGLGLAIARWVVDLHGGSVGFVDPAGPRGALVRVDLPLTPPVRTHQEAPVTTPPPPAPPAPPARPAAADAAPRVPATPSLVDEVFGGFWEDRATPARLALLGGAVAVGLLAALLLPERGLGVGTTVVLLAGGGVVALAASRRRDPFTGVCAGLAVLLALVPTVRDADWLVLLCLLAGAVVTVCGVTRATSVPGFVLAGVAWPLSALRGLPWLGRTLTVLTGLGHGAALARTAALSLAGVLVFGALFVSADAVFARWADALLPDLRVDTLVLRAFVAVAVAGLVLATAYLALNPPRVERGPGPGAGTTVGRRYEWLAPAAVVAAVFAVFLAAQATVLFGGEAYLRRRTGLTYAEWVHQGFGQLTVATALTLLVVAAVMRRAPRTTSADRTWLRVAVGVLCVEALVVVASALHRLDLYRAAYGLTRLRLLVGVFEGWLGVLLVATLVAGLGLRATWLARFGLVTGTVALLGLAAVNPDARIAERNVDSLAGSGRVDWSYLQELSDDAVPTLAALPAGNRACALAYRTPQDGDWLEWNLGRSRAREALEDLPPVAPDEVGACASSG